jgi:hypothetical protein
MPAAEHPASHTHTRSHTHTHTHTQYTHTHTHTHTKRERERLSIYLHTHTRESMPASSSSCLICFFSSTCVSVAGVSCQCNWQLIKQSNTEYATSMKSLPVSLRQGPGRGRGRRPRHPARASAIIMSRSCTGMSALPSAYAGLQYCANGTRRLRGPVVVVPARLVPSLLVHMPLS